MNPGFPNYDYLRQDPIAFLVKQIDEWARQYGVIPTEIVIPEKLFNSFLFTLRSDGRFGSKFYEVTDFFSFNSSMGETKIRKAVK